MEENQLIQFAEHLRMYASLLDKKYRGKFYY